jgi:hypothetical protein
LIDGTQYTIYVNVLGVARHCWPMTPEDAIDNLYHKAALAIDESEFDAVLADLGRPPRENHDYLQSISAEYLLTLPPGVETREQAARFSRLKKSRVEVLHTFGRGFHATRLVRRRCGSALGVF